MKSGQKCTRAGCENAIMHLGKTHVSPIAAFAMGVLVTLLVLGIAASILGKFADLFLSLST